MKKKRGIDKTTIFLFGILVCMGTLLIYYHFFSLPNINKQKSLDQKTEECLDFFKHHIYLKGCQTIVKEKLKEYE